MFWNLDFTWVKSIDKIIKMLQIWFGNFKQTPLFKRVALVGTVVCLPEAKTKQQDNKNETHFKQNVKQNE